MLVSAVTDLAESRFAEDAFTWGAETPWRNVTALADKGFLGINFEESYGGGGMTELEAMLVVEAVGAVCPDTAYHLYNQQFVSPRAIEMYGSDAARAEYLPAVIDGESAIAVAISEPGAGSDVRAMETSVEPDDGGFALTGEKVWVSDLPAAEALVVWTRFPDGLGSVIVDLDAPGVDVASTSTNMAGHPQSNVFFEDVHVPRERVLVSGENGYGRLLESLNWERLGAAIFLQAISRCAIERAHAYASEREQFGETIVDFQGMAWKFADMATELEASRALTYRPARDAVAAAATPDPMRTSMAKLHAARMAEHVISESLQAFGATGYQRSHPLEYLYRLARGYRIAGGTDEIQQTTIASRLDADGLPDIL